MKDTEKILRNWNIVWTVVAIVLSMGVFWLSVEYNYIILESNLHNINITTTQNRIGGVGTITIKFDNIHGLMNLTGGLYTMVVINLLQILIWAGWKHLVE